MKILLFFLIHPNLDITLFCGRDNLLFPTKLLFFAPLENSPKKPWLLNKMVFHPNKSIPYFSQLNFAFETPLNISVKPSFRKRKKVYSLWVRTPTWDTITLSNHVKETDCWPDKKQRWQNIHENECFFHNFEVCLLLLIMF